MPKLAAEEFRRLFRDSRDAIYFGTIDGRLLDINPAGVELFGYSSKEEMQALDIAKDLYWNPAERQRIEAVFLAQGYIEDQEIVLKTRTGGRLRVRETASAIFDDRGQITGFRGILRDLTETHRLEEQLRKAQKMDAVGRLAEGVAHDFNNLLTAINGYSELILAQISEEDPFKHAVSEIRKAGHRAASLTRRLLTLSRQPNASPRKLDLNRVVSEMEKLLRRVLGESILLSAVLDPEPCSIYADQGQIEQVLLNLAINGRDAMPEGGRLTLETANVGREEDETGLQVRLIVRDTGSGIDDEAQPLIFEPFYTTRKEDRHSGLGLAIVDGIIQQCRGRIELESKPGTGSTFRLFFPSAKFSESTVVKVVTQQPQSLPRGHETVLLVEDETSVRELVQRILELQGYRVLTASGAQRALDLCASLGAPPDLLLTDVVMPETSGPTLAEGLQKRFEALRVLFMSGYTDSQMGVHLLNQRRADFLAKPFSPELLAHKVREVLDRNSLDRDSLDRDSLDRDSPAPGSPDPDSADQGT